MQAIKGDGFIIIKEPTEYVNYNLSRMLGYTNKSKAFAVKKKKSSPLLYNPYWNGTEKQKAFIKEIEELEEQVHGTVLSEGISEGKKYLVIPSGLEPILNQFKLEVEDKRSNPGGAPIVLPWIKKPFEVRDYQRESIDLMKEKDRGIINIAMGGGKTLVAIYAIKEISRKTLVICPTDSIAKQFHKQCIDAFGDNKVGFIGGGKFKIKDVTIGIMASVHNKIEEIKKEPWGLVICDEAHHSAAETLFKALSKLSATKKIFGLTATAYRSDGMDILIYAHCGDVIIQRGIRWAIEAGVLAKPTFIVKKINTFGIRDYKDDKNKNYKDHVLGNETLNNQILRDAREYMEKGKRILIIVDEIAHGEFLAKELNSPFAQGEDKASNDYVDNFNKELLPCLVGTDGKIGEGSDIKPVDVLFMVNFMASKVIVNQVLGRALRTTDKKKECIILDYIPMGSKMLKRHAETRLGFYKEITDDIHII